MNQLVLFELPAEVPALAPKNRSAKLVRYADVDVAHACWNVGMLVDLPITATIQGEMWRQYTMGLLGRVELIEGDLAGVRVSRAGHQFDGRLAIVEMKGTKA